MNSKFWLFLVIQCCFIYSIHGDIRKTSLAFVMDTTGSMGAEWSMVKKAVIDIMDRIYSSKVNTVQKLLFVPFNDPGFGPVISTENPDFLKREINKISVDGGGDCSEKCLSGLLLALADSLPNSQIYVFTDAAPKDGHKLQEIINLIKLKQIQVIFILTGYCNYVSSRIYTTISEASSGFVFEMDKSDITQVINWIETTMENQVDHVNLVVTANDPGRHDYFVLVDGTLEDLSIGVTGNRPKILVKNPAGTDVTGSKVKTQVDLPKVKFVKIPNPDPGKWTIDVDSNSKHTVKVTSTSNIKFDYGFYSGSSNEAFSAPTIGVPSKLIIQVINDKDNVKTVNTVGLLDVTGKPIKEMVLTNMYDSISNKMYTTAPVVFPNEPFLISITGVDNEGYLFKRINPTLITPNTRATGTSSLGVRPSIQNWSKNIELEYGKTKTIDCKATGTQPIRIIWTTPQGRVPNPLRISNAQKQHSGTYRCIADNKIGESIETTNILVWKKPYVAKPLTDVEVNLESPVTLSCRIGGEPTPVITWRIFDEEIPSKKYRQIGYTSYLKIDKSDFVDNGNYTCTGRNKFGIAAGSFYLDVIINTSSV